MKKTIKTGLLFALLAPFLLMSISSCGSSSSSDTTTTTTTSTSSTSSSSTSSTTTSTSSTTTTTSSGDTVVEGDIPHADGHSWKWEGESDPASYGYATYEGTTSVPYDSTTAQVLKNWDTEGGAADDKYNRINSSGFYYYADLSAAPQVILEFPFGVGSTWTCTESGTTPFGSLKVTATVDKKESVTVPLGTYDCYKIIYTYVYLGITKTLSTAWIAKGVGVVKETDEDGDTSVLAWKN